MSDHYRAPPPDPRGSGKRAGYGINLYRNTEDGIIAGVCAGLADHFEAPRWQVRLIAVTALLFLPGLTLLAYLAGWLLLAERPQDRTTSEAPDQATGYEHPFRYQRPAGEELKRAQQRLRQLNQRLAAIERYVTSSQFQLRQEINRMKDS